MFVATSLFHVTFEIFMRMTPSLWLKQYLAVIRMNNPDALVKEPPKRVRKQVTLDQIPFFN